MDASLNRYATSNEDQEHHHLSVGYSRRNNADDSEIYFIPSSRIEQADQSPEEQDSEQAGMTRRSWTTIHSSMVMLCLCTALGVLVICVPFLPRRNSNGSFDPTPFICRSAILGVLAILALIVMLVMVVKREKLHEKGFVIWPQHCEHCAFVMSKIRRDDVNIRSSAENLHSLHRSYQMDTYKSPTIKSTLYITYIFSGLSICFMISTSAIPIICIMDDSASTPASQTLPEVIAGGLLIICLFFAVYLVSFRFIPIYSEAHFIAVPKLRWAMVLLAGGAIWMALVKLIRPFAIFANGDNRMIYPCALNSTVGEFLKGVNDISQPFYVELAFMLAWQMMGMWLRFLPGNVRGTLEQIKRDHPEVSSKGKLTVQSSCFNFSRIFKSIVNEAKIILPNQEAAIMLNMSHNPLDDTLHQGGNAFETVLSQRITGGISRSTTSDQVDDRIPETSDPSQQDPGLNNINQRYRGYNLSEMSLAISLVVSGVYFGVSNFLTGETHYKESSASSIRGLYVQYFLKILYILPILILICIHKKIALKIDHYAVKNLSPFIPSHGNYSMLLLTLTGACLFDMSFLAASVGNLSTLSALSRDEIILNIASLFSSLFDIWRKSTETIFLLCILRQYQVREHDTMWTLVCLSCVGIANATHWLWDSFIHEAGSELAWPVLVMIFDGNIGQVIGMLLVPFVHLYGLHTATLAFEIFKIVRYR